MTNRIYLPRELSDTTMRAFLAKLTNATDASDVTFNFSQLSFAYPHATLVAASHLVAITRSTSGSAAMAL